MEGVDYINLNDFDQYQIDGKYHLKILWDFGESVEWKQEGLEKSIRYYFKFSEYSDFFDRKHSIRK